MQIAGALVALALLFALCFATQIRSIEGSLPYPQHIDERFVAKPALRILQSANPDPGFYRYPSLPIYLASLGMTFGVALSPSQRHEISSVEHPYYSHPEVMRIPRILQAAIASASLLLVAAIAYRMRPLASGIVLGPAILAANAYYQKEGWLYLNVDIITSFFALATTLQLLRGADRPSLRSLVVLPAILCGATAASKYPSGLVLLPAMLAVFWYAPRARRAAWLVALVLCTAAAFVAFNPYALLGFDAFWTDLLYEVRHYATGRALHEGEPGLEQVLFYGGFLVRQNGLALSLFAALGAVFALRRDWRRAVLLGLFPVAIFLLLSVQRVHFHRNLVPAYGMLAVFAAIGIQETYGWSVRRLAFLQRPRIAGCLVAAGVLVAIVLTYPSGTAGFWQPEVDSRNRLREWIHANLPDDATLVIPYFAPFSLGGLPDRVRVVQLARGEAPRSLPERNCYVIAPTTLPADDSRSDWLARHSFAAPVAEFGRARLHSNVYFGVRLRIRLLRCR